ncbi:MAG TPA: hypothetical protein VGK52_14020 [Polyangia bacterium]
MLQWGVTRRGAWTVCLSLTVFAAAGTARSATSLSVSLSYDVDPSLRDCPGEDEFRRHVVEQLGTDPFRDGASHHVDARVHPSERGLEGALVWTNPTGASEGDRRLSSASRDCAEFVRGMTFALAVQIQFLNQLLGTPLEPPPAVVSPAREIAPPTVTTTPAPRRPPSFSVSVGPVGSFGEAPTASAGAELSGAARLRAFSLDLGARATLPVTFRQADGTGFRTSTLAGTLAVCGHLRRFALCPLMALGRLQVSGLGVDDAHAPASTTARVGLRAAFAQPLSTRLAAVLHADGAYTLTPRTVTLNQLPVWRTPTLGLAVGIDLAVLFR